MEVNGVPWLVELGLTTGAVRSNPQTLLRPGRNEVVLTATGSFVCQIISPALGVDVTVAFEGSRTHGPARPYVLESRELTTTAADTILVWMPPELEG